MSPTSTTAFRTRYVRLGLLLAAAACARPGDEKGASETPPVTSTPPDLEVASAPAAGARPPAMSSEAKMEVAYLQVRQSLAGRPEMVERLELSQAAWKAYRDAHVLERFPRYQRDPMKYGTVLSMCLSEEEQNMAEARLRELQRVNPCDAASTAVTAVTARAAAQAADGSLNDAYRQVRSSYSTDPEFLSAFTAAQRAWLRFRDAQVDFVAASNGPMQPTCAALETEHVVRSRISELESWLNPPEEGYVCMGSFKLSR